MSSNLASLKNALIANTGAEERVEVNQRHLIDKILARYSAEYTVFRELLQNSNDAGATNVEIRFQTGIQSRSFWQGGSKRVVESVTYANNGRPFSNEDWARLRKIAEGNPDEQKIGFFGVGFYSLFSICEEPFVTSSDKSMAFLWKGDMLYTKRGVVPAEAVSPNTSFFLSLREPADLYDMETFGRFIATSMAFTSNLKEVQVHVDDQRTLFFDKKTALPRPLQFHKDTYALSSANKVFTLESVALKTIQMDVEVRLDGAQAVTSYQVFMRSAVAYLSVRLGAHLVKEMERTTKKRPPGRTEMQIMWSSYDEYESSSAVRGTSTIFTDLLPASTDQGRIFIGFPTYQTTGCTIQLAGHLIPTVERESIDFVDPTLNVWNQELLSMGGLLARILYDDDLQGVQRLYEAMKVDAAGEEWLQKKAAHAMVGFTFKLSTPSPWVGRILSTAFMSRCNQPMSILSSKGIRTITEVRLPDPALADVLKDTPVVPEIAMTQCSEILKQLEAKGLLRKVNISDVFEELAKRPLTYSETTALIQWWISLRRSTGMSSADMQMLLQTALVTDPGTDGRGEEFRPLSAMRYHAPKQLIPADLPLPSSVLPISISSEFKKEELEWSFANYWSELPLITWAEYVVTVPEFKTNSAFVEKVLVVFSRHFGNLRAASRESILTLLKSKECIPTTSGLCKPGDSYFPKVTLFPDLPIVQLTNPKTIHDAFLKSLGVREHVELQMVFNRIGTLNWDYIQLVKYLATCTLKEEEMERLRVTPLFPKEEADSDAHRSEHVQKFRAKDLYPPEDKLREFGLPVLAWTGKWKSHSPEATFMKELGIRTVVPLEELFTLAANGSDDLRTDILSYFVQNYKKTYVQMYSPQAVKVAFLPTTAPKTLATPSGCFSDPSASIMGFQILHPHLVAEKDKFGVRDHPPAQILFDKLVSKPPSIAEAKTVFAYLGDRTSDFNQHQLRSLSSRAIVPVRKSSISATDVTVWVCPNTVYFGESNSSKIYKEQFTYVDFGLKANNFLRLCGTREEPTPAELASSLVANPVQFLDDMGHEKYLDLIRNVATNWAIIRSNRTLLQKMSTAAWLVGIVASDEMDDETSEGKPNNVQYHIKLARAVDIYIVDDTVVNQLFKPLGAPADELLENMYAELGSKWLSSAVKSKERPRGQQRLTPRSEELQVLIRQRAPLLMYDGQQMRTGKDIFSDAADNLQVLRVVEVPEIEVVRTFEAETKIEKTTACLYVEKSKGYWLFVVPDYDYFDIARSIGHIILRNCRLKDSLLLSTLLSTSVQNLRRKGFPVDRILKLTDNRLRNAQIVKEQKQATAVPEPNTRNVSDGSQRTLSADDVDASQPSLVDDKIQREVDQLLAIFPDADPAFLQRELQQASGSREPVLVVTEKLLDMGDQYPKTGRLENKKRASNGEDNGMFGNFLGKARDKIKNKGLSGLYELAGESIAGTSSNRSPEPQRTRPNQHSGTNMPAEELTRNSAVNLKNHLASSISSLRGTAESAFKARVPNDPPPTIPPNQLSRQFADHCSIISENDLVLKQHVDDVPLYVDRAIAPSVLDGLFSTSGPALRRFVAVLQVLANVFGTDKGSVHLYYDLNGSTIAFNRGRTLFFNVRYYLTLHYNPTTHDGLGSSDVTLPGAFGTPNTSAAASGTDLSSEAADVFYYWFLTWCHELAHNFVSEHDAAHEYWMSSFAETYMSKLVRVLRNLGVER
ncbi:hypothetical protein DFS34DRAFT_601439 [Phlyctochytrium arcticum]|nr:hypothetical protein DFS34DRAFT_601439 [Phlyctochytrium arcticum]